MNHAKTGFLRCHMRVPCGQVSKRTTGALCNDGIPPGGLPATRVWLVSLCLCTLALFYTPFVCAAALRPPSVPLVACDPYFSIWSSSDKLTDTGTVHWTGKPHRLNCVVHIDKIPYRVMGAQPSDVAALAQRRVSVYPTRTEYELAGAGVAVLLTFMTPALPDDLAILARPVTYLTYTVHATDGKPHDVRIQFRAAGEIAVNTPDQLVDAKLQQHGDLATARIGSVDQPILAKKGDDIRIDWGYFYVAVPRASGTRIAIDSQSNTLPAAGGSVAAEVTFDLGRVSIEPASRWLILAYDDIYSIQYMKKNLRPYWRRNGWEAADLLRAAAHDYPWLRKRCLAFDDELMTDLARAGGANYASLCALAYRQCFAAGKFVADDDGQPLQFCKENNSNGCIGTSDVFYPMSPQFLFFGSTLTKAFLVPFMNYAASDRWRFPFAPHDLGQYPHANGQRYGGGEQSEKNQMPVEESGNLLLLMAAVARIDGNADFAARYWPQLERWAAFLKAKGFDPENQLCTDDFAGHLAHNVNLSAKAICGLAAFAQLCDLRGDKDRSAEYHALARQFAARWVKEADDGDHFRLAFDRPGTWSQKYNLVWDRILGLNLFPDAVTQKEMAYYRKVQNRYGLPLDNRSTYTKLDWVLWTATLTRNRADFEALVDRVLAFLNATPDRRPMTDWYFTDTARRRGFTARPVVGGVFLQMLYDRQVWKKHTRREKTKAGHWAPMPKPPRTVTLVPTSQKQPATWRYTTTKPAGKWFATGFDDGTWAEGPAGFGTRGTPGAVVRTTWNTSDIWIRRTFQLAAAPRQRVAVRIHHDEDADVFLNGKRVVRCRGYTTEYDTLEIPPQALHAGRNVLAIHCHQTTGGQYIDAGIDAIVPAE